MLLEGKNAVVTGAGSGVGRASALRFAEEGARVACADLDLERAKETVGQIESAGGVAVPNMGVSALSRRTGPVGGNADELDNFQKGNFDPVTFELRGASDRIRAEHKAEAARGGVEGVVLERERLHIHFLRVEVVEPDALRLAARDGHHVRREVDGGDVPARFDSLGGGRSRLTRAAGDVERVHAGRDTCSITQPAGEIPAMLLEPSVLPLPPSSGGAPLRLLLFGQFFCSRHVENLA